MPTKLPTPGLLWGACRVHPQPGTLPAELPRMAPRTGEAVELSFTVETAAKPVEILFGQDSDNWIINW